MLDLGIQFARSLGCPQPLLRYAKKQPLALRVIGRVRVAQRVLCVLSEIVHGPASPA